MSVRSTRVALTPSAVVTGFVFLAGALTGAIVSRGHAPVHANDHSKAPADDFGIKAPIAEILHCPLAFAGVHLLKDLPERSQVAYHFCKPLNAQVNQCVLYDGTGKDARLIGIEYLVTDEIYRTMPADEKSYWHDHKYEVDAGLIRSLTQSGADEKATLGAVRTLWGKVYHTWASGTTYPRGPARLFWSVTGEEPFVLDKDVKLPKEIRPVKGD